MEKYCTGIQPCETSMISITPIIFRLLVTDKYHIYATVQRDRKLRIAPCAVEIGVRNWRNIYRRGQLHSGRLKFGIYISVEPDKPDIRCVGWNMIFGARIKILFTTVHRRCYTLITKSEIPPRLIHLIERNFTTKHLPAPLKNHLQLVLNSTQFKETHSNLLDQAKIQKVGKQSYPEP